MPIKKRPENIENHNLPPAAFSKTSFSLNSFRIALHNFQSSKNANGDLREMEVPVLHTVKRN